MNYPKLHIVSLLSAAAVLIFSVTLCEPSFGQAEVSRSMQPVDKPIGTMNSRSTALLQQPHIRRDLELTTDQFDQITQLQRRHDKMIRDVMSDYSQRLRQLEPAERSAFMRDLAAKRKQSQKEMETEIGRVFFVCIREKERESL